MRVLLYSIAAGTITWMSALPLAADNSAFILDVPDYNWYAGCFGTASGNLMGFWDRNGFPDFYTGPTAGSVAPLNDVGTNVGIRSMWATKAGFDGRPANQFGHIDDYWAYYFNDSWFSYLSTASDPYVLAGRPEHTPDCIGDFIGVSQKHWTNMDGECDGNVDAYCFNYWDASGNRRFNYMPSAAAGTPARDLQSGLRAWTRYRGYTADVFSQLADFNPTVPTGKGFTFNDLKAEIDAGYPVLLFLQNYYTLSRELPGPPAMNRANPELHGMLAYGYDEYSPSEWFPSGLRQVYFRNSWAASDPIVLPWDASWILLGESLPLRGIIGYHPKPKIRQFTRDGENLTIRWDGPSATVQKFDGVATTTQVVHRYQIEQTSSLSSPDWQPVDSPTTNRTATVAGGGSGSVFYRVTLLPPGR